MKELDCVRIVKLLRENRLFDGTESIKRPPRGGVSAAIVRFAEHFCIVDHVDAEGYTVWLADFSMEEVEIYE